MEKVHTSSAPEPRHDEYHPFEISVCGYSGAGKTTLCRRLISLFSARYRVGYVKSDAHVFEMDQAGKDTHTAWSAGAHAVSITDKTHSALLQRGALDRDLRTASFEAVDFVIVEGRKASALPKIVFLGGDGDIRARVANGEIDHILAFVGEPALAPGGLGKPYFQRDQVSEIATFIESFFHETIRQSPLRAVILAGGLSTRMQRDKALISFRGKTQLERAVSALTGKVASISVSARPGQRERAEAGGHPIIEDRFLGFGPLGGIASALLSDPRAAWLVVACDLPLLDEGTLDHLIAHRDPFKMATAFRSDSDGLPEPLCAIYEPRALQPILRQVGRGKSCPRKFLLQSPVRLLDQPLAGALTNVNSPADLAEVERRMNEPLSRKAQTSLKTIHVSYYASIRERTGRNRETLSVAGATAQELYEQLRSRYGLAHPFASLRVAANSSFVPFQYELKDGDEIVFIPPVAGG